MNNVFSRQVTKLANQGLTSPIKVSYYGKTLTIQPQAFTFSDVAEKHNEVAFYHNGKLLFISKNQKYRRDSYGAYNEEESGIDFLSLENMQATVNDKPCYIVDFPYRAGDDSFTKWWRWDFLKK
jgi:hypothetical protein